MVGLPGAAKLQEWDIAEESQTVKFIPRVLPLHFELRWPRSIEVASIVIPLITGLMMALLLLLFGPITLPFVFSLLFILPWLMRDAFRLFTWLIVTWPLLTLFVRIPLPGGIPDLSYDRVLVLLLVCIIIIEALLSKRQFMKVTPLDILIIVYVMVQINTRLSVIWFWGVGNPDLNGFLDVILVPIMLYWSVKNLLLSRAHLQWLLYALFIASLLVCPTGLYEQAVGARIFKASVSLGGSEVKYQWEDVQGGIRAAGALANPAIYGAVLGIGSLAGLCCLPLFKRKLTQVALLATIGFLLYGVFASYTRSAWLSVFAVLFAAQFFINGLWKRTLPIIMLGLLFLILIWNILPNSSNILQRALTTKTVTQRLDLNYIGWERFLEKPFMGWGSGALNIFDMMGEGDTSHNMYLTFLVDGGLPLFLSFSSVVGYLLIRSIRVYKIAEKSGLERNVLVAMTGSILIFLLSGMALELRYFGYFNALFWICAGVIDCLGERYSSVEPANG
jgi:hypothetical protein